MLLQTNSYIVPKEKRIEHARLLRRFRQALARVGCDHFEVYEQVGSNWTGETTGRFVQIMRFRDRGHQLAVQAAEREDQGAQELIREFCELINFPYQQQQGFFAVGFYNSVLPVAPQARSEGGIADNGAAVAAAAAVEAGVGAVAEEAEGQTWSEVGGETDSGAAAAAPAEGGVGVAGAPMTDEGEPPYAKIAEEGPASEGEEQAMPEVEGVLVSASDSAEPYEPGVVGERSEEAEGTEVAAGDAGAAESLVEDSSGEVEIAEPVGEDHPTEAGEAFDQSTEEQSSEQVEAPIFDQDIVADDDDAEGEQEEDVAFDLLNNGRNENEEEEGERADRPDPGRGGRAWR
jgi:hypothetical protein